jgi:hypothetical protein
MTSIEHENNVEEEEFEIEEEEEDSSIVAVSTSVLALAINQVYHSVNTQFKLQHPPRDVPESQTVLRYTGFFQGVKHIFIEEGLSGFVKGFSTSFLGGVADSIADIIILPRLPDEVGYSYFMASEYDSPALFPIRERVRYTAIYHAVEAVTDLLGYPFRTIAVKLQSQHPVPGIEIEPLGLTGAASQIIQDGGFTALYRGFHVAAFARLFQSLTFVLAQEAMMAATGENRLVQRSAALRIPYESSIVYELVPSLISSVLVTPLHLLQVRLQQNDRETYPDGAIDAAKQIYKTEGIRGFYKGTLYYILLSFFGKSHK